jgi:hypothetical protein
LSDPHPRDPAPTNAPPHKIPFCGGGWGPAVPEADAALNCLVPERCIKYASDWSYAATVADDLDSFILTKI